jgi:hypothetical protein
MAKTWCCPSMKDHATYECGQHGPEDWPDCPHVVIHRFGKGKRTWYGIPIHDGGASAIHVTYCPWCGARLDSSKRTGERRIEV